MSYTDQIVAGAAQVAKWLLIASSATAIGIRILEWWRSQSKE